jgi:hypothetical protein
MVGFPDGPDGLFDEVTLKIGARTGGKEIPDTTAVIGTGGEDVNRQ